MYCDFSTVTDILSDHLSGTSIGNYKGLLDMLFSSYLHDSGTIEFDRKEVSKYRNSSRKLPSQFVEYYLKADRSVLLKDIFVLLTYQFDRADLHKILFLLMCNDEYLSVEYRKRIKRECSSIYSDDKTLSELIYEAVYTAVARPYTLENGLYYVRSYFNADLLESSDTLFINAKPLEPCKFFCGRDEELEELHKIIRKKGKVIVTGVIGVGKSELVRAYAKKYASDYKQVIYCLIDDSKNDLGIEPAVSKLITSPFDSLDKENNYDINLNLLSALGKNALLIFDNYNVMESDDEHLSDILNLDCDVLFTSLLHYDDIPVYILKTFRRYAYGYELINSYYPFEVNNVSIDQMKELIKLTDGYPFSIDLCGRHLKKGLQTVKSLLAFLYYTNGSCIPTKVSVKKDGTFEKASFYEHISKVFYNTTFNETEIYVLSMMRFVPKSGISKFLFLELSGLNYEGLDVIEKLIDEGFIYEYENGTVTLPALINRIVDVEIEIEPEDFVPFFEKLLSCDSSNAPAKMLYEIMSICEDSGLIKEYEVNHFALLYDQIHFYITIGCLINASLLL